MLHFLSLNSARHSIEPKIGDIHCLKSAESEGVTLLLSFSGILFQMQGLSQCAPNLVGIFNLNICKF